MYLSLDTQKLRADTLEVTLDFMYLSLDTQKLRADTLEVTLDFMYLTLYIVFIDSLFMFRLLDFQEPIIKRILLRIL
jgi:hypothetical protein